MLHPIRISCQRLLLCCLLLIQPVSGAGLQPAQPLQRGKVVRVFDGDSVVVRTADADVEVRLADIDAPEKGQPYADNSRKALIALVQGREVTFEVLDIDTYGRSVSRVRRTSGELDINSDLVRRGHAWVYRRYVRDQSLLALEESARARRAGLWALPEELRIAPWNYRGLGRAREQPRPRASEGG